ncbi:MAG: hypothetical protein CVU36_09440 [Betaproteobacteria bacterium HGW-Betaproteobacteria-9]|jgi:transposase|nr:MAG: hypothetical protein CVU36_09440 [Betaproteobacteria bacterium HGW-Betaproteobacteria-9]
MSAKQVRAQYTREYKLEAVCLVRGGQSIAVTAKALGTSLYARAPRVAMSVWGALQESYTEIVGLWS